MRKVPLIVAAVLGFLVALAVFLPAQLIGYGLSPSVTVGTLSGSVWNGSADYVAIAGRPLGAVHWKIHPLALFLGRLSATVETTSADINAHGELVLQKGGIELQDFKLDSALQALPTGGPPLRWNGRLQGDLRRLSVENHEIRALLGTIDVHGLQAPPPEGQTIGSYRLTFDDSSKQNGQWIGKLRDLEGPMEVSGTLALGAKEYLLEGQVVPRAGASAAVLNTLRFLGPPDGQGHRPFSIAGTY